MRIPGKKFRANLYITQYYKICDVDADVGKEKIYCTRVILDKIYMCNRNCFLNYKIRNQCRRRNVQHKQNGGSNTALTEYLLNIGLYLKDKVESRNRMEKLIYNVSSKRKNK